MSFTSRWGLEAVGCDQHPSASLHVRSERAFTMPLATVLVNSYYYLSANYAGVREMSLVTGEQLRAARAMLRMEQETLAETAGVSVATIRRMERFDGPISARTGTLRQLQRALEAAGVEFIDDGRPGVRVREPIPA